jgi:molybdopterin synthase catalytic subunit
MITVRVQAEPFDLAAETAALAAGRPDIGALATFTGLVRGKDEADALTLEHYPAMTERALREIAEEAARRWPILAGTVIHRHGRLAPGEPIVLVAIAAAHRGEAFAACEFLMDYLKTRAPFWKKEEVAGREAWVEARAEDESAAARWE